MDRRVLAEFGQYLCEACRRLLSDNIPVQGDTTFVAFSQRRNGKAYGSLTARGVAYQVLVTVDVLRATGVGGSQPQH